jgi:uncharacterized damage-inducible protein DinB
MNQPKLPEPWLRGTLSDVQATQRAVLHALEGAKEDLERWCAPLTDEQLNTRPTGIAAVAFHIRHIVRSCDRLLTYAEGRQLSEQQLTLLKTELDPGATSHALFAELNAGFVDATTRIRAFRPEQINEARGVGKKQLPTTVAGLLVHVADHTQRHTGQAITTAKIVTANS